MPEKKKIKPNVYLEDIFETGDLIAIQLKTAGMSYTQSDRKPMTDEEFQAYDGKYILLQKIRTYISWTSQIVPEVKDHWATFRLFDGVYDEIPVIEDITALKDACLLKPNLFKAPIPTPLFYCESSMFYFKRRKYKLIGNFPEGLESYQKLPEDGVFLGGSHADSILLAAMKTASGQHR